MSASEKTYDDKKGVYVHVPTECEICGWHTGQAYDVHMAIMHPETRPQIEKAPQEPKRKSRKNAV